MDLIESNRRALLNQFDVVWDGAMERAGLAPRLSRTWRADMEALRAGEPRPDAGDRERAVGRRQTAAA